MKQYKAIIFFLEGVFFDRSVLDKYNDLLNTYFETAVRGYFIDELNKELTINDKVVKNVLTRFKPDQYYIISRYSKKLLNQIDLIKKYTFFHNHILSMEDEKYRDTFEPDALNHVLDEYLKIEQESVVCIISNKQDYLITQRGQYDYKMALWAIPDNQIELCKEKYDCIELSDVLKLFGTTAQVIEEYRQTKHKVSKIEYDSRVVKQNISSLIKRYNLTAATVAKKLNMKPSNLYRLLKEDREVSLESIFKFAQYFNVSANELVGIPIVEEKQCNCNGFLEYNNEIIKINSFKDLKKLVERINFNLELPKKVKRLKNESNAIRLIGKQKGVDYRALDLYQKESIDPQEYYVWTFRKNHEHKYSMENPLGNMGMSFKCKIAGHEFLGSEQAYIAGMFSNNTNEHIGIQKELLAEASGYDAKKKIRRKHESKKREDWESFNVQWMLYVVWQKCLQNKDFANILRRTTKGSIIIENSSEQNGSTAGFWGCKNKEWKKAKSLLDDYIELTNKDKTEKEREQILMDETSEIDYIGIWEGVNCMGKILTICRECLLNNEQPPIDYELLKSKHIHILGKELIFDEHLS